MMFLMLGTPEYYKSPQSSAWYTPVDNYTLQVIEWFRVSFNDTNSDTFLESTRLAEVSFGEWLKRRRKSEGLTQEQLAEKVSCSTITLRKIEGEERRPSAQIAERLAEIFNIPSNEQTAFLRFARGDWRSAPAETREDAPWRVSSSAPRSNLPATVNSVIGREQEFQRSAIICREQISASSL